MAHNEDNLGKFKGLEKVQTYITQIANQVTFFFLLYRLVYVAISFP